MNTLKVKDGEILSAYKLPGLTKAEILSVYCFYESFHETRFRLAKIIPAIEVALIVEFSEKSAFKNLVSELSAINQIEIYKDELNYRYYKSINPVNITSDEQGLIRIFMDVNQEGQGYNCSKISNPFTGQVNMQ